jgi:hypothetical protein
VLYAHTAKEVWDDLQHRYSQSNGTRVHHLKQAIASLKQESLSVNDYFTHLKVLWEEFLNYRPIPSCACGAKCVCGLSKTLIEYQHYDYVHSFLMGLNKSYTAVRGQILLMEPLPGINKVSSLIQNHEKQKGVGILPLPNGLPSVETTALISRMDNGVNQTYTYPNVGPNALLSHFDNTRQSQYPRKDKPTCTHCGFKGHTAEKCYKLHGYPPGFRGRNTGNNGNRTIAVANQVLGYFPIPSVPQDGNQNINNLTAQCQQLLNMLTAQTYQNFPQSDSSNASTSQPSVNQSPYQNAHQAATLVTMTQPSSQPPSNMAGSPMCLASYSKPNLSHYVFSSQYIDKSSISHTDWVIETGATDHMVITTQFFTSMLVVHNVSVNLPNGQSVTVTHIGSVQISSTLLLTDVLCVPSFDFNLISVLKLTSSLHCCIFFLSNYCFI